MKNITFMIMVAISMLFVVGTANATYNGYTKIDSWTMEGVAGLRASSGPVTIVPIQVQGFNTEADCLEAVTDIQNRVYPATSGSSSTIIPTLYSSFQATCHKVKVIVPTTTVQ